ncbi:DUF2149 domain-containing protein [Desulfobacter curvatus]|uniref:DUF2149 domain-containing protein n=1 Tax=Desulfobacter curvatus TaxID=2290 RepID=UPI000377304B|nr:DUF2149 domain-containing protein [Desulfobacter curvatus]
MVKPHSTIRRSRSKSALFHSDADDPMSGVANLFDVAMVFAVALILGIFHVLNIPELLMGTDDVTIIKNPGKANMEIIQKNGKKMEKYTMSREDAGGNGQRLGVCYRLEGGEMVYVPESTKKPKTNNADN